MIKAETPGFRGTIGLDFKKRYKISGLSLRGSQRDAIACPEAARCLVGPGGTWAWTMSWEVDGTATKPQPDLGLTTSAGEKEKRLSQSDNKQSNLKNREVPTK